MFAALAISDIAAVLKVAAGEQLSLTVKLKGEGIALYLKAEAAGAKAALVFLLAVAYRTFCCLQLIFMAAAHGSLMMYRLHGDHVRARAAADVGDKRQVDLATTV